jgi:hypothetical protein
MKSPVGFELSSGSSVVPSRATLTLPLGLKPAPVSFTVSPELWQLRLGSTVIVAAEAVEVAARHATTVAPRHSFI